MKIATVVPFALAAIALIVGCSDPMEQPATEAKGAAGLAAKHLMETARNSHYVSPEKKALLDPQEPKEVATSTSSDKSYRIGVCLAGTDRDFDAAFSAGINEQAQARKVTVDILNAEGSAGKQASELAGFQKSKENAVVVVPVEAKSLAALVATLNSSKVPVIAVDQNVPGAASEVTPDEAKAGQKAVFGIWGAILKKQSGTVAVIVFKADSIQEERANGFGRMASQVRNIKAIYSGDLPQNTAEAAEAKAAQILRDHPDISAFFAANDNLAIGVSKAITDAKSQAGVISIGADADARQQIKTGQPWFADVIEYPHLMGVTSIDAAVKALQGDRLPTSLVIPVGLVVPASFK